MNIIQRLTSDVVLMEPGAMGAMISEELLHFERNPNFEAELLDIKGAANPGIREFRSRHRLKVEMHGEVAVIPVEGALARKPSLRDLYSGNAEDTDDVTGAVLKAAIDPSVQSIVLSIDSPGGFLTGGPELASAIRGASTLKPVIAHTSGMMASLAYWAGSQASAIVASESSIVGSIGVYSMVYDFSKMLEKVGVTAEVFKNKEAAFKAIGLFGTSLNDTQREHMQTRAQQSFDEFRGAISSKREIAKEHMQGQTFYGKEAKKNGMVDRVGDLSFAISLARHYGKK